MGRRPNRTEHLTDAGVAALSGEHLRVYDSVAQGLHLRVTRGSKTWKVGPDIIGKFPAMSVAEARERATVKAPTSLTYLSVCSGIEAASCAWEPLGFRPVAFAEINEKARAFLAEKYPGVPQRGDFTKIKVGKADILVGGPPCQDFSKIGRKQIGERADLTLQFLDLARRIDASWFVFENVPDIVGADSGLFFRRWLARAGECGFSVGWRVLNLQQFGLPNLRRRLFAIGHRGAPGGPASVLFGNRRSEWPYPQTYGVGARTVDIFGNATWSLDIARTETFGIKAYEEVSPTFRHGRADIVAIFDGQRFRKMSIVEYERCMGFPDNYTAFSWKGSPASPAMRQALLGNSFSPAILHWIGRGIVEAELVRKSTLTSV